MKDGTDLRTLGEFGLIDRIVSHMAPETDAALGIGDDAAAFHTSRGCVNLITTDMLIEEIHFNRSFCDPASLGKKALSVNLSDMAAMGGKPRYFLLSLAVPPGITLEFLDDCIKGMLRQAERFGVHLIGGDTCSSPTSLVLNISLLGEQSPDKVVRRSGARPGDHICVTGTVGDSALGLRLLKGGKRTGSLIARHLDPTPRVSEGLALADAGIPSAMIDLSDGLLADLTHILDLSSVGARIYSEALPLSEDFRQAFLSAEESLSLALSGGEDYELLFTAPPEKTNPIFTLIEKTGTPVSIIGAITKERKLAVIDPEGKELSLDKKGFDHFS